MIFRVTKWHFLHFVSSISVLFISSFSLHEISVWTCERGTSQDLIRMPDNARAVSTTECRLRCSRATAAAAAASKRSEDIETRSGDLLISTRRHTSRQCGSAGDDCHPVQTTRTDQSRTNVIRWRRLSRASVQKFVWRTCHVHSECPHVRSNDAECRVCGGRLTRPVT